MQPGSQALGLPRQFCVKCSRNRHGMHYGEELLATIIPQTGGQGDSVSESSSTDRPAGMG